MSGDLRALERTVVLNIRRTDGAMSESTTYDGHREQYSDRCSANKVDLRKTSPFRAT